MAMKASEIAFVRRDDAPLLPAPKSITGIRGWMAKNLFSSPFHSVLTVIFGAFALWLIWDMFDWLVLRASWTGVDRTACNQPNAGQCWPLIAAKFPQWIYGFFPIDERWRVNLCFLLGVIGLVPMMIPSVPHKFWNAIFLLVAYPLIALILLSGGHFGIELGTYLRVAVLLLLTAVALPLASFGAQDGISRNRVALILTGLAVIVWLAGFFFTSPALTIAGLPVAVLPLLVGLLIGAAGVFSIVVSLAGGSRAGLINWAIASAGLMAAMLLLDVDFGLVPVETDQWGGLTVTLVIAVTGIVVSLPIGILLALGRRSEMPVVRMFSVVFIEVWRGVPLITVLFMSSVMLPLFLPPGISFDKLLRVLIVTIIFISAYMAEAIRGGLQAIPRGQYEGAMALGLSYWQVMSKIILPQALKISVPNIVSNFIGLFRDTTLVSVVGLFDLLGIVRIGLKEALWTSPSTTPTGYLTVALMFWVFCFAMSRYSMFIEGRLNTGHKR